MSSIHTVRKSTDYSTSTMPLVTPAAVTTVLGTSNVNNLIGCARGFDRLLRTPHATVVLDSLPALLRCDYRISEKIILKEYINISKYIHTLI